MTSAPEAKANDYNSLAWAAVFAGADLDKAIEDARRADGLQPGSYAPDLYKRIGEKLHVKVR